MDAPAPDEGTTVETTTLLHEAADAKVLYAVVTTGPGGNAVFFAGVEKEVQDSLRTIVVMGADRENEARVAVYCTVDDDTIANEAFALSKTTVYWMMPS